MYLQWIKKLKFPWNESYRATVYCGTKVIQFERSVDEIQNYSGRSNENYCAALSCNKLLTLGLLAVSQVGSTARLVTVPAVTTRGKMAPSMLSALYLSELQ